MIIFAIGGYALLDAVRRRYMPMQREVYLLLILLLTVLVIVRLFRVGRIRLSVAWVVGGLIATAGFSVMPALSVYFDLTYFVGDLVIVTFLVVLIVASQVTPEVFNDPANQKTLLIFLFAAMLLAPAVQTISPVNDQIVPPHMFLIAASWAGLVCARDRNVRLLMIALLVVELVATYNSEQRANVMLWLGFGFLTFVLRSTMRQKVVIGIIVLSLGYVALGPASDTTRNLALRASASVIESSRFGLLQEGPDASLLGRYLEVQDVWLNMEENWTPAYWLMGAGHGATYRPLYRYTELNMKDGRIHNIHFGPMLVFFRYGVLGVALYLVFVGLVAIRLLRPVTSQDSEWQQWWNLTVGLACVGAVLTFFLSNTLQDPVVTYTVAAFLSLSRDSRFTEPVTTQKTQVIA